MVRRLFWIAMCCAGAAQAAGAVDSAGCRAALAELERRERALATAAADRPAWRQARRAAALACLGAEDAPPARHLAQPPVRVAPVEIPPPPRPQVDVPPPARPTLPPPPPTITACDAAGCWASDGTRWQRNGPDLVGPRGLCTVVGQQLRCP